MKSPRKTKNSNSTATISKATKEDKEPKIMSPYTIERKNPNGKKKIIIFGSIIAFIIVAIIIFIFIKK